MDNRFGVRVRLELMARAFESMAKFAVVIDFPIEDNLDRAIFIAERLMPRGQIDNGETAKPQCNTRRGALVLMKRVVMRISKPMPGVIGATMFESVGHSQQGSGIETLVTVLPNASCDSAHGLA
jgi:hypothetical protein